MFAQTIIYYNESEKEHMWLQYFYSEWNTVKETDAGTARITGGQCFLIIIGQDAKISFNTNVKLQGTFLSH